ncbi:hypothetical protein V5799_015790 [Amblyomma americanum]|uniref:Uncharacterized protein n=1 Tax=Amblyomma americanum TaxID=6943 RepID=A0AAQ4F6Z7_AMBAM
MPGGPPMRGEPAIRGDAPPPPGRGMPPHVGPPMGAGGPRAKRGRWEGPPSTASYYQDSYYNNGASQDYGNSGGYDDGYGQAPVSQYTHQYPYNAPSDMMVNSYQSQGIGSAGGYGDGSGGYNRDYSKPPLQRGGGDFRSSGAGYAPPAPSAGGYASSYDDRGYGGRQGNYGGARPAVDSFSGGGPRSDDCYASYDSYGGGAYGQSRDSYGGAGRY